MVVCRCPRPDPISSAAPHTYHVQVRCALGQALFDADESARLLALAERLRQAFDVRVFAYLVQGSGVHLVLRHAVDAPPEDRLRQRWALLGGRVAMPIARLRQRFTSLAGFMQTLLQRFARDWNQRHGQRGHLWAGRYRACLLADDAALIAAVLWLEGAHAGLVASSAGLHGGAAGPVALAPLPLRVGPDQQRFLSDEAPPGLAPPPGSESQRWLDRFRDELGEANRAIYGAALERGWALGRPDSLSETAARLGRSAGRGRSRQVRELDDELGLCGVWG